MRSSETGSRALGAGPLGGTSAIRTRTDRAGAVGGTGSDCLLLSFTVAGHERSTQIATSTQSQSCGAPLMPGAAAA